MISHKSNNIEQEYWPEMKLIKDGNLVQPIRDIFIVLGLALIWGGGYFFPELSNPILWLCVSLGTLLGGLGAVCHLAYKSGLKPFDNSYKKAKATYSKTEKDHKTEEPKK